jgi:hypothetical protein
MALWRQGLGKLTTHRLYNMIMRTIAAAKPAIHLVRKSDDGTTRACADTMDGKIQIAFPTLYRAHATVHVARDFFPRV